MGHLSLLLSQSCLPPPSAALNLPPPIHPNSHHLTISNVSLWSLSLPPSLPFRPPLASDFLSPCFWRAGRSRIGVSYLIILGEQLGEFRIPPLRCFFLGERVDGCSSSTGKTHTECQNRPRDLGKCSGPDIEKQMIASNHSTIANKTSEQKKMNTRTFSARKLITVKLRKCKESISNGW